MSRDVRLIDITFENLDYLVIPAHYFFDFQLEDIQTCVQRVAANSIQSCTTANQVFFRLRPEVLVDANTFEGDICYAEPERENLYTRLQRMDITHLTLIYNDATTQAFDVAWEDADAQGFTNRLQSVSLDQDGMLCVQIGRNFN